MKTPKIREKHRDIVSRRLPILFVYIAIIALLLVGCGQGQQAAASADEPAAASDTSVLTTLDPAASYDSAEDVALYIHEYGQLPSNYITKAEARELGWEGGSLEQVAPGMCIGGDYFGNYEGLLPEDAEYRECDIDTLGKKSRGAKRLIYSDDGAIYYTDDHYESFTQLY